MAKVLTAAAVARMTQRSVARARGHGRDGVEEIADGGAVGLYLLLYPNGKKAWALRYRRPFNKRPAKLTLGPVSISGAIDSKPKIGDHLTLVAARRLVAELKHNLALGRDPGREHHAARYADNVAANTFAAAARDFAEQHKTRNWKSTIRFLGLRAGDADALEIIGGGLVDRWGDRPLSAITEDELFRVIDAARTKGVPGLKARKGTSDPRVKAFHSALSGAFSWFKRKRLIAVNPMIGLHRPKLAQSRERVLTDAEVKKFWAAASREGEVFAVPLKVLLLTGQRRGEVEGMRRGEISDDGLTWTIPGARTKNHRVHVVPLSPLVRSLIASVTTSGDLIFTANARNPITLGSKLKARLDAAMSVPPWRLHDLRRTAATGMAEIGVQPHIVEAVLNHVSGARAGVAGVYNRAAYVAEKKAALERWASHVAGLMAGRATTVVPLRVEA